MTTSLHVTSIIFASERNRKIDGHNFRVGSMHIHGKILKTRKEPSEIQHSVNFPLYSQNQKHIYLIIMSYKFIIHTQFLISPSPRAEVKADENDGADDTRALSTSRDYSSVTDEAHVTHRGAGGGHVEAATHVAARRD